MAVDRPSRVKKSTT
jgi:hypothetical protein